MIQNLSDKQTLVRADAIACTNKWAEAIGHGHVIYHMCRALEKGSPELRLDGLNWIIENMGAVKDIPEKKDVCFSLCECLQDKKSDIRSMAEKVITEIMGHTGWGPFEPIVKDLKPGV